MGYDITELQAVDFALGAVIAASFDGLAETGPGNYIRFLQRATTEKVYRVDHSDGADLLKKISTDKKGAGADAQKRPELPVAAYFRKPGLNNGDARAVAWNKTVFDEELLRSYRLSVLPVSLDYSMTFAAWDKPTLDKMVLAWYAYIARKGRMHSRFIVPTRVGADVFETPANVMDPRTIMFDDASAESSERRLYAVSTDFTINTHVLVGEAVTHIDEITVHGIVHEYIRHSRSA
jgi:hypothetical protein